MGRDRPLQMGSLLLALALPMRLLIAAGTISNFLIALR
jgi:hypothetical protein